MNIRALASQYLLALVVPSGRLPRTSFIAMVAGLAGAFALIGWHLHSLEAGAVWGWQLGVAMLLIWAMFCVVSRRMHDVGRDTPVAVALLLVSVVSFLASLDPTVLGADEEALAYGETIALGVWWLAVLAFACVIHSLYRADGQIGENRFGPEFGLDGIAHEQRARAAVAVGDAIGRELSSGRQLRFRREAGGSIGRVLGERGQNDSMIPGEQRGLAAPRRARNFGHR